VHECVGDSQRVGHWVVFLNKVSPSLCNGVCGASNIGWISQLKGSMNALGTSLDGEAMDILVGEHLLVAHKVLTTMGGGKSHGV